MFCCVSKTRVAAHNYPWFVQDKNCDKLRGDCDYERMLAEIRNYADKYRQEFGASSF